MTAIEVLFRYTNGELGITGWGWFILILLLVAIWQS